MEPKVSHVPYPIITTNLPRARSSIGSSPRSGLQEERYEQLVKEFQDIDRDHNNVLSFDEIHDFLSEKQGEAFDLTLCKDLFNRMDKNHDNVITLEEFVDSYVEVEDLIVQQMKAVSKEIKKNIRELEESKEKLKKAELTEIITSSGIMQGSVLTFVVLSAQNLNPSNASGSADPFVRIECGGKVAETGAASSTLNPVWNESFTFPISSKGLDVKFTVLSKSLFNDKLVGKVLIPLSSLADQLKHEQYFALQGENENEKWQGRIRLEIQWIWSKTKYLKDINTQWEKIINEDKERLDQLKEQLSKLRKPFGHLGDLYTRPDFGTPNSGTMNFEDKFVQKIEELTSVRISIMAENEDYLYYSILAYMLLAVLMNFARPDFFNCVTSLVGFFYWIKFEYQDLRLFAYMILFSEIYDFLWLVNYASEWAAMGGVYCFVIWVSFVVFVLKVPLGIVFWRKSTFHY